MSENNISINNHHGGQINFTLFETTEEDISFIAPAQKPYNEVYAENIMTNALISYVNAGHQYEYLSDLTNCAINNQAEFMAQLQLYKNRISLIGTSCKNSLQYLSEMIESGEVVSWSRKSMNYHQCEELLMLADNREKEYNFFAYVLEFIMSDDYAHTYYISQYPELLYKLLETDADIASELYQIVCIPHLTGKYADDSTTAQSYEALFESVPKQNKHLTGEDVKQARVRLISLKGARNECLSKLNSCGVFEAYKK